MSKRIVITGTSRGIGFELAQLLANAGHEVVALSRKIDTIQALENNSIHAISTDLSAQSSIDAAAKNLLDKWDRIDILIHNAGMLVNKPFEQLTPADFQQCYAVNVFGVAALTQALMPVFKEVQNSQGLLLIPVPKQRSSPCLNS